MINLEVLHKSSDLTLHLHTGVLDGFRWVSLLGTLQMSLMAQAVSH